MATETTRSQGTRKKTSRRGKSFLNLLGVILLIDFFIFRLFVRRKRTSGGGGGAKSVLRNQGGGGRLLSKRKNVRPSSFTGEV